MQLTVSSFSLLTALILSAASARGAEPASAAGTDFFEAKIRPILVDNCYACHSAAAKKLKGELYLDSKAGILKGGESAKPALVPGNADSSRLIVAVRQLDPDLKMPPKKRLTDQQIADLVAWINMGAPDPRLNGSPAPAKVRNDDLGKDHWAFKKPVDHPAPQVRNATAARTDIDRFILAKLEEKNLAFSPDADKRTLIRRATFDLVGLPPTPQEVDAFVADASPDAYDKLIDRLLSSPHYGERWGRYWLDLARYSDSKGYVYDRDERFFAGAYSYRDWVTRSFNDDLPYDQFLLQQIAADQVLPAGSRIAEVGEPLDGAANQPSLAGLGFLTMGRRFLGVQPDVIDDRIDVLSRTTQGLSVGCARCHDHKFDPISTQDYYSLYGVFAATHESLVPLTTQKPATPEYQAFEKGMNERVTKLNNAFDKARDGIVQILRDNAGRYLAAQIGIEKLHDDLFYSIMDANDVNPFIARQWQVYLLHRAKLPFDPIFAPWLELSKMPPEGFAAESQKIVERILNNADPGRKINGDIAKALREKPPKSVDELASLYGSTFKSVNDEWRQLIAKDKTAAALSDADREAIRAVLYAPDSPANMPPGRSLDLSWFFGEGSRVELAKMFGDIERWINANAGAPPHLLILQDQPGTVPNPRVFKRGNPTTKGEEVPRQFLKVIEGEKRQPFTHGSGRLEMAQAIVSKENPLTARVMVNRIWMHHFGAGLVTTPSDFGTRCDPPSHPELLDHLAVQFMEQGWSIKKLHRKIMLSAAYRQGSAGNAAARSADPENRLLWRMNRSRLDFESMRDALLTASGQIDLTIGGRAVEMFKPPFSNRRTVYGKVDRQYLPGVLRVFDFANPDLHIPARASTTVPQQALFFLNSPFVVDRAKALVARPEVAGATNPPEKVRQMYRILYQRDPTPAQVSDAAQFISTIAPPAAAPPAKPIVTAWQYGFAPYDASKYQLGEFKPLPYFNGTAWQGGRSWPDAALGWAQLTADGGHAGNDLNHAVVRRWIAPRDLTVSIRGVISHSFSDGDGIRAHVIVAGKHLASWTLFNSKAETNFDAIALKKGTSIDFVVDFREGLNNDQFVWTPVIADSKKETAPAGEPVEWDPKKEFAGPPPAPLAELTPWEEYAQVLLLSNEFVFVD